MGATDGASMLLACGPDFEAQGFSTSSSSISSSNSSSSSGSSSGSIGLHAIRTGEDEWARGLPWPLSRHWLGVARRDVAQGLPPRAQCVRASVYLLSSLLPTPLSAADAFANPNPKPPPTPNPSPISVLPEWRLILAHATHADSKPNQTLGGLVEQEALLAGCPNPVPGQGLRDAAEVVDKDPGARLGAGQGLGGTSGLQGSVSYGTGGRAVQGEGLGHGGGLNVGWEDRALPPSALSASSRGPCRLLRIFVTMPKAWLRGLPVAQSAVSLGPRVVIASTLFWIEGAATPVPPGVRQRLIRTSMQAGSLFASLLLEACRNVLTVTALGARVVALRGRLQSYSSTAHAVRSIVQSGLVVSRDCLQQGDEGLHHTLLPELDRLMASLAASDKNLRAGLARQRREVRSQQHNDFLLLAPLDATNSASVADAASSAGEGSDEGLSPPAPGAILVGPAESGGQAPDDYHAIAGLLSCDSLVPGEDAWLRVCIDATGEALGVMATTADQLCTERREKAQLSRALARARVQEQGTARHMREFAEEVANMLPASAALRSLEARLAEEAAARDRDEREGHFRSMGIAPNPNRKHKPNPNPNRNHNPNPNPNSSQDPNAAYADEDEGDAGWTGNTDLHSHTQTHKVNLRKMPQPYPSPYPRRAPPPKLPPIRPRARGGVAPVHRHSVRSGGAYHARAQRPHGAQLPPGVPGGGLAGGKHNSCLWQPLPCI